MEIVLPPAYEPEASNEPDEQWDVPKLQALMAERDDLEAEIRRLNAVLLGPQGAGLVGGLVDKDGFPTADFEKVISVRESRQKLACT